MNINAYIESGILELYVAGTLSEKENMEVYALMQQHPEILQEILEIEAAVIKLTASTSQRNNSHILQRVKQVLGFNDYDDTKVISITKPKYNWLTYSGWAASIVLAVGLFWATNQNKQLKYEVQTAEIQQSILEIQIADAKNSFDVVRVYKNNQFVDSSHSSPFMSDNGQLYYFKQDGEQRVLYKDKQYLQQNQSFLF